MIAAFIEQNFPHNLLSPYSCIALLLGVIFFLSIIRKFDVGIFVAPLYFDLVNYRLQNLFRRITFQKPYVISGKELLVGGGGDDWTKAEHTTVYDTQVTTSDIDIMMHMNNARYLRNLDIARFEWLHKSGLFHAAWFKGCAFVTASQTIRYRRELRHGVNYRIITRCTGWDKKAVFLEHLFCVKDEIHAISEWRGGISVPRKMKEKYPQTAEAPMTWIVTDVLKWTDVPEIKKPSADIDNWLNFLNDNYTRVIGDPSSPTSPKKKN